MARDKIAELLQSERRSDADEPSHVAVDVRKIDNGFISRHTREEAGEYKSRERFHEKRPSVEQVMGMKEKKMPEEKSHLRSAIELMKRGRI